MEKLIIIGLIVVGGWFYGGRPVKDPYKVPPHPRFTTAPPPVERPVKGNLGADDSNRSTR
jgi:hypothetical protein